MKKKKLASLIVLVFVLLCNCDYFKSLCEPENDPKKQPTTLQNIVNNATDGEIINLEEWENVTDYTATIDKKLTIKSGNLNGASLTVKAENVKLEKMQNLSVETSSRLTIKDSKLNNLLLDGNAQSRSNTTAEINVILENCEIAEKIKINSQAKLNITGKKTKIAKIVVAVVETLCKIFCAEELDTTEIKDIIVDEDNKKLEDVKVSKAYKIVYHSNCDELEDIEDFFSPDDGTISLPTDIFKRDGYIFAGWYKDEACKQIFDNFDVSDKTENIDVYAKWESTAVNKIAGIYKLLNESATIEIKNDGTFVVTVTISGDIDGYMNGNWKKANEENYEFIFDDNTAGTAISIEEDVIKMVYKNENEGMDIDSYAVKISNENVDLSGTWIDENSIIIIKEDTFTATLKDGSSKNGNVEKTGNFFKLQELAFGAISTSMQVLYIDPYGKEITPSIYTKSTTNEESFEDLGGTGVYSYKLNLNDISNAWNGSQNNPNFSIVLLTDAQVKASVNKFNFSSYAYQFYSYGDMGVGNPIMPGNYAVYGKNCYENSEYKYYSGVAATVTDTTLEVFVDMSQIMKAELKFFNSDTESEANLVTENMPVDLTDYKPYVFALIDGEKDPDNYVMTNETWKADLMAMTGNATFPTDLQQSPPTTGNTNSVTVTDNNNNTETINFSELSTKLSTLSAGTYTLKVSGTITNNTITEIANAMNSNTEAKINLDLSDTDGLTEIPKKSFQFCNNLISINIPKSVTIISSQSFEDSGLTSVMLPNNLQNIGKYAFFKCSNLASIEIPDSVTTIGTYAFYNCSSLTSVTFKDANNWYCTSYSDFTGGQTISVTNATENATYLKETNSDKYWYKVTTFSTTADDIESVITNLSAGAYTLKVSGGITNTTITTIATAMNSNTEAKINLDLSGANGLTEIPENAFCDKETYNGCTSLLSINIPDSVTTIGEYAFANCSGLTSIEIPNSVTSIGDSAFYYCENLTSVIIGSSVTTIDAEAFSYCSGLTSINIPDSVESIGILSFLGCNNLTTFEVGTNNSNFSSSNDKHILFNKDKTVLIAYPSAKDDVTTILDSDNVTTIGDHAFFGCSNLTSIKIPDSVTTIGQQAFHNCSNLTNITIGNKVTSIGDYAFSSCSSLTSIEIPNSVTTIGTYAFSFCSGLTSIEIPNSVTTIGDYAFSNCSRLTSIEIPNSVTTIGTYAFFNCSRLTSVTIGNGVTSIGASAFYYCDLRSIEIPNSVTTIDAEAFYYCEKLTSVTFKDTNGWYYNDDSDNKITIDVTDNTVENATYLKETYSGYSWYKESSTGGTTE